MDGNFLLSGLNVLIAILGILFVVLTIYEYKSLSRLRDDFERIKKDFKEEMYRTQKAMQRVIASYGNMEPAQKISLLEEAVAIDPSVFNGFNTLGYIHLQNGNLGKAIDAFNSAISHHPTDKAGYFDLAFAHLKAGDEDLCLKYLKKAIKVDPTSRTDLQGNAVFEDLRDNPKFTELLH